MLSKRIKGQPAPRIPLDEGLASAQKPLETLWTSFAGVEGRVKGQARIAFVSPHHGAGTTTVAGSVALGLARNLEGDTTLVESNGYSPALATYFGDSPTPGLTDLLDETAYYRQCLRLTEEKSLHIMPYGSPRPPHPGELTGQALHATLEQLAEGQRFLLVDGPPLLPYPPARFMLELFDWVVLVIQANTTKKGAAKEAIERIEEVGTPILGTVVNRFQSDMPFGMGGGGWV